MTEKDTLWTSSTLDLCNEDGLSYRIFGNNMYVHEEKS